MIKQYTKNNKKLYMINNLYLGVNPFTGKEVRKTKRGFESKKEAELYSAQLKIEFNKGTMFVSNKKITFEEVYKTWLENYRYTIKESTHQVVIDSMKIPLKLLATVDIKKITMLNCQKLINEWSTKYSLKYISTLMLYTKMVFDYAVSTNILNSNPMDKVKKPKIEKEIIKDEDLYYTKDELIEFLSLLQNKYEKIDYLLYRVLAFTGMRIGELLALKWEDIDFNNSTISINKTLTRGLDHKPIIQSTKTNSSTRVIEIDTTSLHLLREHKLEQQEQLFKKGRINKGIVFTNNQNNYYYTNNIRYKYAKICKQNNFKKIKIHGFRHTHCSLLFESGATIQEVQFRLGHSDIKTTMNIYNHVTEKMKEKTATNFANYMSI